MQADHRHLLVDELQDLTPAHVLLVRLAAGPAADVFGVGDDDQTHLRARRRDPRFLIDYARYFPGAGRARPRGELPLPGRRSPTAAATLLAYNGVRVAKEIRPGPDVVTDDDALRVHDPRRRHGRAGARRRRRRAGWPSPTSSPEQVAVLARVQSLLLAPHVALAEAGVPVDSILDESVLVRLGVRAALAYVRIAVDPDHVSGADLAEVHRRPSRGLPQWATKWLDRCRSVGDVRRAAARIDDAEGRRQKLDDLAVDLDRLASLAAAGRHRPRPAHRRARRHRPRLGDDAARQHRRGQRLAPRRPRGAAPGGRPAPRRRLVRGVAAAHVPPRARRGRRHPVARSTG